MARAHDGPPNLRARMRQSARYLPALAAASLLAIVAACGGSDGGGSTSRPATPAALGVTSTEAQPRGDLLVFAASSLTDAFTEIGGEFRRRHPAVNVTFNFAASSALRTQIEQGARADLFASADQPQMDLARKAGAIEGDARVFAKNRLVVIVPAANPGRVLTLQDLARPGLRLVLADRNVPVGAYARDALARMAAEPQFGADFARRVLANLRSEEANVRAVVAKVQLGEADAGIVYATDVTPAVAGAVTSLPIPEPFNVVATYPIAVVKDARNRAAALAFIDFVRSAAGQAILKKHNFIVDGETGGS